MQLISNSIHADILIFAWHTQQKMHFHGTGWKVKNKVTSKTTNEGPNELDEEAMFS